MMFHKDASRWEQISEHAQNADQDSSSWDIDASERIYSFLTVTFTTTRLLVRFAKTDTAFSGITVFCQCTFRAY